MSFPLWIKKENDSSHKAALELPSERKPVRTKDATVNTQLEMIELTHRDLAILTQLKPWVEEKIDWIVSRFYETLEKEPSLFEIIHRHSSVERLKKTLTTHVIEMFEGRIDEAFIEKRTRIAVTHLKIGLLPKWYMCAFQQLQLSIIEAIVPHWIFSFAFSYCSKTSCCSKFKIFVIVFTDSINNEGSSRYRQEFCVMKDR
ncbi:heam-based aerotactic trancducer [Parageobacillus thermantarcticus]|uniref:Heam-based aerotactic trancducer n=1 Tax=Parageobacillus thermantarcticus TaxID=186116 RepID=A0A1I0TNE8_9BACL|nr:protoglobin domain-containing protein [Parageobacillus thermantarcticus]SFA53083.1 heam-based aerotactic trancducer [Parageobacillus thermantarcticus]